MTLAPGEAMKRPGMLLSEALERFKSLVDGQRLHPAQPLPRNATERDYCTLFIHDCQGSCKTQSGLLEYLQPYLPANLYKIRAWLPRSGLLVLLNSDESIRELKGPTRPICKENDRAFLLSCFDFIDGIVIFHSRRCDREIAAIAPDVYVKGGDYTVEKLDPDERGALLACKAEIRFIPFVPGFSTTTLIEKSKHA